MRSWLPVALIAAVCVAFAVIVSGGDEQGHRFSVVVGEATNVVKGQFIRRDGIKVGRVVSIEPVNRGRDARLELEVDDEAWPLPRGSKLALRWGGTANFGNRYIAILAGRRGGSAVAEGGVLPTRAFVVPVEYDELLASFPASARRDLRRMFTEAGPALAEARGGLQRTLDVSPPALAEASAVLQDVNADQRAVRTLVRSADRVLGAVQRSEPDVRRLLSGAGETFDAVADEAAGMQLALDRAPGTFRGARQTLASADETLDQARELTGRIDGGITEVRRTAAPLNSLLTTVRRVGPDATATLATARRAVPDLNPLLERVTALSPQLETIGEQSVENLKCIRPFTPDANAFFSNWGDFHAGTDGKDKLIRAQVQSYAPAFSNVSGYNSAEAAKLFPGLEYGFPRPPGTNAGQPWFLPECGAGPDALDPNKDPEIRTSAKVFDIPKLLPIVRVPRER